MLDLETLTKFTEQAQKLQAIARELQPFFEMMKKLDVTTIIPTDRLIQASEAAEILDVNNSARGRGRKNR